jgi:hypothetical protein
VHGHDTFKAVVALSRLDQNMIETYTRHTLTDMFIILCCSGECITKQHMWAMQVTHAPRTRKQMQTHAMKPCLQTSANIMYYTAFSSFYNYIRANSHKQCEPCRGVPGLVEQDHLESTGGSTCPRSATHIELGNCFGRGVGDENHDECVSNGHNSDRQHALPSMELS